jgi:nitrilase
MPLSSRDPFVVASVQHSPVFLDRAATVDRACELIADAAAAGARLILFPEGFLPGYPLWIWHVPAGDTATLRELYAELLENAVELHDASMRRLASAAADHSIVVAIGVNERNAEASGTSLYNAMLVIDDQGSIRGCHRKLVPTTGERLVHAQGDGSTLDVYDTGIGRVGGLVCWENYMPLARYALYAWGVEIYLAPTWDQGEPWTSTLRHIAKEGRVHVISSCSAMRRDDIPDRFAFKSRYLPEREWINVGGSAIVDPDGRFIVEPAVERQEILYGTIDPRRASGSRFQLDVAGHYGRPDIFRLSVDRTSRPMVLDDAAPVALTDGR